AAGLAALHAENVIHRDLSPNNILFDGAGAPLIADLGLAQTAGEPSLGRGDSDQPTPHPGTPGYRSPEHADGYNFLKPPADVYALGLLLFEMLTLKPYSSCRPGTRLSGLRPDVPAALDELVAGMLSEDPRQRPWDGAVAEKALQELSAADPAVPPVGPVLPRTPSTSTTAATTSATSTWTLEEGLMALKEMEEVQEWQLALETLEQLETAFPGHVRLILPRKRITQALQSAPGDKVRRDVGTNAKRGAAEPIQHPDKEKGGLEANPQRSMGSFWIRLNQKVGMEFIGIPAGDFLMGSDPQKDMDAWPAEQPQNRINLPNYWIGRAPVTNAQYAVYVSLGGTAPAHWKNNQPPQDKLAHPVVNVSWQDATDFCEWLGRRLEQPVRLPTEAEWEKAARGTDGLIYPWGDQAPDLRRCNFANKAHSTTQVGLYSPAGDSPYGCMDMAGNVREWCADWYREDYYLISPKSSPPGPLEGQYRVTRGGSWDYEARYVRAANRNRNIPGNREPDQGFRCLLVAAPQQVLP
ncbi:MAG TPA: SUMF1/EgtB/PvdO family nonheme iron enzyme, partial [Anaerolineaceae bacterium]|nr:SUMF1/EgtB/PvdO family nonheme iron enzyme [Anaerolineaceae bacterium]